MKDEGPTVSDYKKAFDIFIKEARKCAETPVDQKESGNVLGFSAISMAFSAMLAVGQAIRPEENQSDEGLIINFIGFMEGEKPWLLHSKRLSDPGFTISKILIEIRHSLAHQISLPKSTCLVVSEEKYYEKENQNDFPYGIVVGKFIDNVGKTGSEIFRNRKDKLGFDSSYDPMRQSPRRPVEVSTSGSKPSV
jgi:hypothetical protein